MDFFSFVLLNFLLLVRPEDLFPPIAGFRLYLIVIIVCTITSIPGLVRTFDRDSIQTRPIVVCVLGLLFATLASFLARGRLFDGLDFTIEFGKVILYFCLLVSVVNTEDRLRSFVRYVALFIVAVAGISLCQHFEVVEFPGLEPVKQWAYDEAAGEEVMIDRVVSVGLFADPNDLCVMIAFGMVLCVGLAMSSQDAIGKLGWLLPLAPLAYTCFLTKSRGGMLAILAGVGGTAFVRLGYRRSIPAVAVAVPILLLGITGRQSGGGNGGTAHERLMLWAHGLGELFRMPFHLVTGLAPGFYVEEFGQLAHNSYVNAYVELGILGGGFFFGAFYYAIRMSYSAARDAGAPPWAVALGPYLFGAVCAYAVGCYSLTRNFHLPTYLALGLMAAYVNLARPIPDPRYWVDGVWWKRLVVISVVGLVTLKYATQLLGNLGV